MKLKLTIVFLIFMGSMSCKMIVPSKDSRHFSILKANYTNWTSGIYGGGRGTEYSLEIKVNSKYLLFDSLVVGHEVLKIKVLKRRKSVSNKPVTYEKGDTLTLRSSGNRYKNEPIWIYYRVANKNFNRKINIQKQESINYP